MNQIRTTQNASAKADAIAAPLANPGGQGVLPDNATPSACEAIIPHSIASNPLPNWVTPMDRSGKAARGRFEQAFLRRRSAMGAGSVLAMLAAQPIFAQDLPVSTPQDLLQTAKPIGFRSGAFEIYPQVTADVGYNDNIYNQDQAEVSDGVFRLRPSVAIDADFSRHAWRINLNSEFRRYFDQDEENSEQAEAVIAGRLDLADRITVTPTAGIARRIERRGTFGDSLRSDAPIAFIEKFGSIGIARTGARIEARAGVSYNEKDYSDAQVGGRTIDLTGRDVRKIRARGAVYYEVSPSLQVLGGASYNTLSYEINPTFDRGSEGYSIYTGVRAEITNLLDAELAIGYGKQDFKNPGSSDYSGLDFQLTARWVPTPRLQVTALGSRSVERSPAIDTSAVVQTTLGVAAEYALGSKTLVRVDAGYNRDDYRGVDRTERRFEAGSSVRYLINDNLSAFAAAGYRNQTGSGVDPREYSGMTARIGITMAL